MRTVSSNPTLVPLASFDPLINKQKIKKGGKMQKLSEVTEHGDTFIVLRHVVLGYDVLLSGRWQRSLTLFHQPMYSCTRICFLFFSLFNTFIWWTKCHSMWSGACFSNSFCGWICQLTISLTVSSHNSTRKTFSI